MHMPDAGLVLTIGFTALMIYDLWCVRFRGTGSSVSNFCIRIGFVDPPVVLGTGMLIGHLFLSMSLTPDPKWYTPGYNIAFSLYFVGLFGSILGLCYILKKKYKVSA